MADFTVEGIITVDSSKAIRSLTTFQTKLRSVVKDVKALDRAIDRIDGRTIKIDAETTDIKQLKAELDSLRDEKVKIEPEVDVSDPLAEMAELEASIRAITHDDVETKVVLSGAAKAIANAEKLHTELEAVSRPVEIPVKYDRKPLRELLSDVNLAKSSIGGPSAGVGTLVGAIAALAPALAPLTAVSAGVLGGFVSSVTVATAGVAGFGIVAIPTFKKIGEGIKLLNQNTEDMSPEELADYNKQVKEFKKTNPYITKAAKNFNVLKQSYMALNKQIQPHVLAIFNNGLKIGNTLLQSLAPMVDKSGKALADLSKEMSQAFEGKEWQAFFDYLNKNSGNFIRTWGRATGNFITGIANMIRAFDPLTKFFNKGLLGMSEDFRKWSANLGKSEGFQKFVDYVKENGPKVKALLGSMIDAIIQLGIAFAPLGTKIIEGATKVFDQITAFAKQHPKVTAMSVAIGGLALAMAPLLGPLLSIAGPLVSVLGALGASGAAVAGAAALATAAWGVAAALAFGNKESKKYKPMIDSLKNTFETFKEQMSNVGDIAQEMWTNLNNSGAVEDFQEAFTHMSNVVNALLPVLTPLARMFGSTLVTGIQAFAFSLNTLWSELDRMVTMVKGFVEPVVNAFKWMYDVLIGNSIVPDTVNGIKRWFMKLPNFMLAPVRRAKAAVIAAFQAIKGRVSAIGSAIAGAVRDKFNAAKNAVVGAVSATRGAATSGFSAVLSAVKSKVSQVPGIARNAFNTAKNAVQTAVTSMVTTARSKFTELVGSARAILSGVKGAVVGAFEGASGWLVSAGTSIISGLTGAITSAGNGMLQGALNAITSKIPDWKGPKSKDKKLLKPTGKWIMEGLVDGLKNGSAGVKSMLGDLTGEIYDFYKKKFKSDKAASAFTKSAAKLLKWQYKNIVDVGKAYDRYAAAAKKAADRVKELKTAQNDYANSVQSMVVATGNVTGLGQDENGNQTAGSIVSGLNQQVANAQEYARLIQQLTDAGLNNQSLQDLIDKGVEGGLSTARALMDGGAATIAAVNEAMTKLAQIGKSLGAATSDTMYAAGISAAQGVYDGLVKQQNRISQYLRRMARALAESVGMILGGKKPTKNAVSGAVNRSFNQISKGGSKDDKGSKGSGGGNGGADGDRHYHIRVTAGVPNAEIGRQIVKSIEAFENAGGRKKK